jgi:hypothetical protein
MRKRVPAVEARTNLLLIMLCSRVVACKSCMCCVLTLRAGRKAPVLEMSNEGVMPTC